MVIIFIEEKVPIFFIFFDYYIKYSLTQQKVT